jgi:hypothetical protein
MERKEQIKKALDLRSQLQQCIEILHNESIAADEVLKVFEVFAQSREFERYNRLSEPEYIQTDDLIESLEDMIFHLDNMIYVWTSFEQDT